MPAFRRDVVLLLLCAAVPAALAAWLHPGLRQGPAPLRDHEITLATALGWGENVLWVDARGDEAHATGHIPGAISFEPSASEDRLLALMEIWEPGQPVVVYCDSRSCDISRVVAERLREDLGTEEVYYLQGGWEAWETHQALRR